jgi:hypothetical protein
MLSGIARNKNGNAQRRKVDQHVGTNIPLDHTTITTLKFDQNNAEFVCTIEDAKALLAYAS